MLPASPGGLRGFGARMGYGAGMSAVSRASLARCAPGRPLANAGWPGVARLLAGVAALAAAGGLLQLGGCAGGPGGPSRTGPAPSERAPDKDGPPPSGAPTLAELARLPDPVPQIEPIRAGGPNKPYVVLGQAYTPLTGDVAWSERGAASWYGHKFHGRRTASGELYSMYGLTAAHKTLPIPSYVRVRNVRNGKEIIVRVNDRGPFHASRVMDLSYAAAVKLDIAASGTGQIELSRLTFNDIRSGAWQRGTVLDSDPLAAGSAPLWAAGEATEPGAAAADAAADPLDSFLAQSAGAAPAAGGAAQGQSAVQASLQPSPSRAHTPAAKGFWVQLATLGQRDGVDRLQQRIGQQLDALLPMVAVFHEPPFFKLQAGPYRSRAEAQVAAAQARRALQLEPLVIERR